MDKNEIENLIDAKMEEGIKNFFYKNPAPVHTHNNVDSIKIDANNLTNTGTGARMYISAAQNIATATDTKVALNQISFSNNMTCDITNNRIVAQTGGTYLITGQVTYDSPVDGNYVEALVYVNNANVVRSVSSAVGTNLIGIQTSYLCQLLPGGYVELWAFHNCGVNEALHTQTVTTYLQVSKVY